MLDIVAWARRFVATPSVSRDGNEAIAKLACELLSEIGAEPRLLPACHGDTEHFTVLADLGPEPREGDRGLLLLTHLDTVPPGDAALWTETGGDPFRPVTSGDQLFGLGSADAKVDLVCKAAALEGLDRRTLRRPLRVVGTFAEEIGLIGARWLVGSGHLRGFRFALVGEPSELAAIRAHKGYSVWEARIPLARAGACAGVVQRDAIEGHSAHSSTPHLGENAIEAALERLAKDDVLGVVGLEGGGAVNQVPARCELATALPGTGEIDADVYDPAPLVAFLRAWRELHSELAATQNDDFDPACTVGNLGRIELADGCCELSFDLRPVPGVDVEQVVAPLAKLAELRCLRTNPPLSTAPGSELVQAVRSAQRAVGLPEQVATKATCTEAGLLAQAGLDAVVMGAGRSVGNVHRPNECTRIPELDLARQLYRGVIETLCTGDA